MSERESTCLFILLIWSENTNTRNENSITHVVFHCFVLHQACYYLFFRSSIFQHRTWRYQTRSDVIMYLVCVCSNKVIYYSDWMIATLSIFLSNAVVESTEFRFNLILFTDVYISTHTPRVLGERISSVGPRNIRSHGWNLLRKHKWVIVGYYDLLHVYDFAEFLDRI